ncbi:MAG: thioredoxin fold domain-containing protein [Burkholderiales bacterium]
MRKMINCVAAALAFVLAPQLAQAKPPDGWPFVEYNEAARTAQRLHKPMFVYFGFPGCPYCEIANKNAFSIDALRKLYSEHYVLAYFDIRGNPADIMTLPGGEKIARGDAVKRLRASPVPAWMFVSPEGKEILMRRGSRTPVQAFLQFDQYVSSAAYQRGSFENFLVQRGLHEARPPE